MELRIPLQWSHVNIVNGIITAFGGKEPWVAEMLAGLVTGVLEQYADPRDGNGYDLIDECASSREAGLTAIRHFIALGWLHPKHLRRYERDHPL